MQIEWSTDLAFRSEAVMKPLYEAISREAIVSVKAEQVMGFLSKKMSPSLAQELDSRLSTRIEGTCIKHRMGKNSIKMYDKFARVLRIETTSCDVSFFKHHRKVEHRDGHAARELASVNKSIYSLIDLRDILLGCNRRYLEFLSAFDALSAGKRKLDKLTMPTNVDGHRVKGCNFFDKTEIRSRRMQASRAIHRPGTGRMKKSAHDLRLLRVRWSSTNGSIFKTRGRSRAACRR
jgi:hypothetical protein